MDSKDRNKNNLFMSMEAEKQVPTQVVVDAFGPEGLEVEEGSRHVSISDEEKVTADRSCRSRNQTRSRTRFGVRLGDEVCNALEVHAASVHEFFDWSGLVRNSNVKAFGSGQARGVHEPAILKEPPGLERRGDVGKYLLLLSDLIKDEEKTTDWESPISQKRITNVAKPLETTVSNGRLDRPDRGHVQSRRQVGSCAQPDQVRDWNREEQELRGGRRDQSRFNLVLGQRASFREFPAPTTFVIDLFSTGTDFQRFS